MLKLPDDDFVTIELVHDPTQSGVDLGTGLTSGAVNDPYECATTTKSCRSPTASHHRVGVLVQAGGVVVARQIRRHHLMTVVAQLGLHQYHPTSPPPWISANVAIV